MRAKREREVTIVASSNERQTHVQDRLARFVDQVIDGALARERIVGTVVLISIDGDVVLRRAAGFADREAGRTMTEDAIFLLASVTKPIVSAAALAMSERGMLGLDDPVTTWLPRFRPRLKNGSEPVITVRHLLTHTSGLDYGVGAESKLYSDAKISNGLDMPGLEMDEAMSRLASVPLLFEPGTAWNYSLSTDVLGAVMDRASGTSLPEIVSRLVTTPLGMTDTGFSVTNMGRLVACYVDGMPRAVRMSDSQNVTNPQGVWRFSPKRILDPKSYPSGGAGMAGTAADVLALLEAIRSGGSPILNQNSARAFATNALPESLAYTERGWTWGERGWTFGLGASVLHDPSITRTTHEKDTWHWGGAYGHEWFVNPARRLSVVSFTNTAFEGVQGTYPIDLRDAIYYALTSES
jgi:CubicO group peptidase (beta-lactamase class C family)